MVQVLKEIQNFIEKKNKKKLSFFQTQKTLNYENRKDNITFFSFILFFFVKVYKIIIMSQTFFIIDVFFLN